MADVQPVPEASPERPSIEPAAPRRGKLKIFFGAFPGVGKTDAMLAAARRIREGGREVVAGVVDTHGSTETAAALEGFESLPPPRNTAGEAMAGELDLDGALARHPEVILVDELAHDNPPGARHPKRWNDVDELLANGIDVFTAMSVQHLESLNDVVVEITGIAERETVPDTFFDTAEETIMVDMSADELLLRYRAGKVFVREPDAGARFFRKGNLLALREIALRRTADVVEDEVQRYRAEKAIEAVWKTQGHVLCCVGPEPGAEHIVRSAARLGAQLDSDWTAVYVETPHLQRLPAEERARILGVVSLAQELGARTAILTGGDAAEALVDFARDKNISTVVIGRSSRGRFRFRRTMAEAIAAASDDIDLIEIGHGHAEVPAPAPRVAREPSPRGGEKRARYFWTVAACVVVTLAMTATYPHFDLANIAMLFMVTVVLVGVRFGRGPAIVAALLNVLAFDFFFVPPRFSLVVSDPQYLLTFGVMLTVGLITGQLAGSLRFQARIAAHRERRASTLYEFARDLSRLQTTQEVIEFVEAYMSRQFRARVAVLVPDATGTLVSPTGHGMTNPFDSTTAQWAYDQSQPAGAGTDTMAASEYLFLPLRAPTRTRGVLAVRPERSRDLMIPEQRHQFDIFAALVATAIERVHYVDVARDALLMAGIHSGEVKLEFERRSIAEIVDTAIKALGTLLSKHPIALNVPRDLPLVRVDARLLQRVVAALLGNVTKHTPAGTRIQVEARVAGDLLEVSVADDGPGLAAGREDEVFESFTRGGREGTKRGAGLGLAISRAIVAAHGGRISADKGRKKGARFVFTLPLGREPGTAETR